ncbi:uncharacterized protein LOC132037232 [Lycium ferocissimum]|uniref:uncharacterized protein LOC132037232 n=1 Tax=Lycium ferocissimum TaxID=112874 RepID=UPI00281560D1|nr:uncharacterized protein LOC132037232 [Lycium ferocissimum]
MPYPDCGCPDSKKYVEHFEYQRLLQFLMDLNKFYSQSSNQIMLMIPTPSINKAYAMIMSEESRRSMFSPHVPEASEGIALFGGRGNISQVNNHTGSGRGNAPPGGGGPPEHYHSGNYTNRPRTNDRVCDFCHVRNHSRNNCYKLHGYPSDYKGKKKCSGTSENYARENNTGVNSGNGKYRGTGGSNFGTSANFAGNSQKPHYGEPSQTARDLLAGGMLQFTKEQYNKILQMLSSENEETHSAMAAVGR